jgi:hypothetical protein
MAMREKDFGYEYPIRARRYDCEINVRRMRKDEMPEDGITYYCEQDGSIYSDGEPNFEIIETLNGYNQ